MVTKHKIPCSCCGKIVERYIFCKNSCKVKGSRERKASKEPKFVDLKESDIRPIKKDSFSFEGPQFSDIKLPGYHLVPYLGKYKKD